MNDEGDDDDDLEGYEGSLWFTLLFWFDLTVYFYWLAPNRITNFSIQPPLIKFLFLFYCNFFFVNYFIVICFTSATFL